MVKPRFVNAALNPYLVDAPLQMVATDFIGPLPEDGGRRYILVIIDAFSRFPETYPVRDMSVSTVIECFRDYFARYGFPDPFFPIVELSFRVRNLRNILGITIQIEFKWNL